MPGIMDSITSVLQSPAVQELLPTALGAAGGFLTTPRRAGFGGAVGRGLQGAAQGITQGQEALAKAGELKAEQQRYNLLNQQVQTALQQNATDQPTLAQIAQTQAGGMFGKMLYGDKAPDFSKLSAPTLRSLNEKTLGAYEAFWKGQKPNIQVKTAQGPDGLDHLYAYTISPTGGAPQRQDLGVASQENVEIRKEMMQGNEALKQATLANAENEQAANQAIREATLANTKSQQATMDREAKQNHFNTQVTKLSEDTARITGMLTSSTPAAPDTVDANLEQRNALARTLKSEADKEGFEYDPELFEPMHVGKKPGALNKITGGIIPTENPTIERGNKVGELRTDSPLVGRATKYPDGQHKLNGKVYTVKDGKIVGYAE